LLWVNLFFVHYMQCHSQYYYLVAFTCKRVLNLLELEAIYWRLRMIVL